MHESELKQHYIIYQATLSWFCNGQCTMQVHMYGIVWYICVLICIDQVNMISLCCCSYLKRLKNKDLQKCDANIQQEISTKCLQKPTQSNR